MPPFSHHDFFLTFAPGAQIIIALLPGNFGPFSRSTPSPRPPGSHYLSGIPRILFRGLSDSSGFGSVPAPSQNLGASACEPSRPLQHSKMPRTPNLPKICPDDCFSGFQSGGPNLSRNCRFSNFRQIFDKFGSP